MLSRLVTLLKPLRSTCLFDQWTEHNQSKEEHHHTNKSCLFLVYCPLITLGSKETGLGLSELHVIKRRSHMKRNSITFLTAVAIISFILILPLTANAVVNWTRGNSGNHVLPRSAPGSGAWDEAEIFRPMVIIDAGSYVMWYSGANAGEIPNYRIGRAVSPNGITWTKDADPVLEPTGSDWESVHVAAAWIIKMPSGANPYKMWYTGTNDPTGEAAQIGLAESADGVTWTRSPSNPVLSPGASGDWDDLGVAAPVVLYDSTSATPYKMWYKGWRANQSGYLGYATSTDGIH
jgi:hypothetical protein